LEIKDTKLFSTGLNGGSVPEKRKNENAPLLFRKEKGLGSQSAGSITFTVIGCSTRSRTWRRKEGKETGFGLGRKRGRHINCDGKALFSWWLLDIYRGEP